MKNRLIISVDPGDDTGIAMYRDDLLVRAQLVQGKGDLLETARQVEKAIDDAARRGVIDLVEGKSCIVLEVPQLYPHGQGSKPANDVVALALAAGAVIGRVGSRFNEVVQYWPSQWKKQLSKDKVEERVAARLSPEERGRIQLPAASYAHNVWEAIGIGLYHSRRWTP